MNWTLLAVIFAATTGALLGRVVFDWFLRRRGCPECHGRQADPDYEYCATPPGVRPEGSGWMENAVVAPEDIAWLGAGSGRREGPERGPERWHWFRVVPRAGRR